MYADPQQLLMIANDRIDRDLHQAQLERQAREARRRRRRPLRQRASRLLIRLGERLAAEPALSPARSR